MVLRRSWWRGRRYLGGARCARGFTILELLISVGLVLVVVAAAAPVVTAAMRRYALTSATQGVAAQIRAARLIAVSRNVTMRVRFNCPEPGAYRIIEVVGNAGVDQAADRCSQAAYPYPDPDPAVRPNADRQVMYLPDGASFGTVSDIEIAGTGRITRLTGCPACVPAAGTASVTVTGHAETRTITLTPNGRVQVQIP